MFLAESKKPQRQQQQPFHFQTHTEQKRRTCFKHYFTFKIKRYEFKIFEYVLNSNTYRKLCCAMSFDFCARVSFYGRHIKSPSSENSLKNTKKIKQN